MEYDIQPNTELDPEKVEQRNRERLIPEVLDGLRHHIETIPSKEKNHV